MKNIQTEFIDPTTGIKYKHIDEFKKSSNQIRVEKHYKRIPDDAFIYMKGGNYLPENYFGDANNSL